MNSRIEYYDSHLHLLGLGFNTTMIDLTKVKSIIELHNINTNSKDQNIIAGKINCKS